MNNEKTAAGRKSVFVFGDLRVSLLSDSLVRIESRGPKGFEDRPSYSVPCRTGWSGTECALRENGGEREIVTAFFTVHIPEGGRAEDVRITSEGKTLYRYCGRTGTNVYLPSPSDELGSWYFTDDPRVIPSAYGYKASEEAGPLQGWDFGNRATDIYVFLPRGDYRRFRSDHARLTGRSEMAELQTLGYWDSRWHPYSEETALKQIETYRAKGYSLDVLVIDVDWKDSDSVNGGGIGYKVNKKLFPDVGRFLKKCADLGVSVCFNDHPMPVPGTENGLEHEEVKFREKNLTAFLEKGLDYWWYDRNWHTALCSFDPEVSVYAFGMYLFYEITKNYRERVKGNGYARRSLILGNVDGCRHGEWIYASDVSAHRFTLQWTGDIETDARALRQEIYTAVFGNTEVGVPYISSDIGGHVSAVTDEMYVRWMQYGALSAILRVHCTNSAHIKQEGRMPWLFGGVAEKVTKEYVGMRYCLLPLYYALAHENYTNGMPVLRRLDVNYPQYAEARRNDEYLLGDYILIAPIAEAPAASRTVFFPEGTWLDVWTGKRFAGPDTYEVSHPLETSPIFVREGALVPLAKQGKNALASDWGELTLDVYPSADHEAHATLYEDDATTVAYKDGAYRTTDFGMTFDGSRNTLIVTAEAAKGRFSGERACEIRKWTLRVHSNPGWGELLFATVNGVTAEISRHPVSDDASPFALAGAARDGEIAELCFAGDVRKCYTVELRYAHAAVGARNEAYDAAPLAFSLSTKEADGELPEAAGVPFCGTEAYEGIGSVHAASAEENEPVAARKGYCSRKDFGFQIRTEGAGDYVFYAGGFHCTAKLSVRDRAGNVRTEYFGDLGGEFMRKIIVHVADERQGELCFSYAVHASEHDGTDSPSRIYLSDGYLPPIRK